MPVAPRCRLRSRTWIRTHRAWRSHPHDIAVFAGDGEPADAEHFRYHARTIRQRINSGSAVMSPSHGHFNNLEPGLASQEQNLRVKAPALDLLQRKHCPGNFLTERLETALSVLEVEPKHDWQQYVEDSAEYLAGHRLALGL